MKFNHIECKWGTLYSAIRYLTTMTTTVKTTNIVTSVDRIQCITRNTKIFY